MYSQWDEWEENGFGEEHMWDGDEEWCDTEGWYYWSSENREEIVRTRGETFKNVQEMSGSGGAVQLEVSSVKDTGTPCWLWPSWMLPKAMVVVHDQNIWPDKESWDAPFKGSCKQGDVLIPESMPEKVNGYWMVELLGKEGAIESQHALVRPTMYPARFFSHLVVEDVGGKGSVKAARAARRRRCVAAAGLFQSRRSCNEFGDEGDAGDKGGSDGEDFAHGYFLRSMVPGVLVDSPKEAILSWDVFWDSHQSHYEAWFDRGGWQDDRAAGSCGQGCSDNATVQAATLQLGSCSVCDASQDDRAAGCCSQGCSNEATVKAATLQLGSCGVGDASQDGGAAVQPGSCGQGAIPTDGAISILRDCNDIVGAVSADAVMSMSSGGGLDCLQPGLLTVKAANSQDCQQPWRVPEFLSS